MHTPDDLTIPELDRLVEELLASEPPSKAAAMHEHNVADRQIRTAEHEKRYEGGHWKESATARLEATQARKATLPTFEPEVRRDWLLRMAALEQVLASRAQVLGEERSRFQGAVNRGVALTFQEHEDFSAISVAEDRVRAAHQAARNAAAELLGDSCAPAPLARALVEISSDLRSLNALTGDTRPAIRSAIGRGIVAKISAELTQKREAIETALSTQTYAALLTFRL